MSAFIVDREDIDVIVTGLVIRGVVSMRAADVIGRELWAENLRSVAHRYPRDVDGARPGPLGFRDADVETYTYSPNAAGFDPAQLAEVTACYRYQSCECGDWDGSAIDRVTAPIAARP